MTASPFLVLDDGRAGHTHQAMALVNAMAGETKRSSEVGAFTLLQPWKALAPRLLQGAGFGIRGPVRDCLHAPRNIVGAGRRAALVGRWARQRAGARYVQILDPRIAPDHFDCVVAPEHDEVSGGNVIPVFGALTQVTPDALSLWRAEFPTLAEQSAPRGVLLIGAPTQRCRWTHSLLEQLIRALRDGGCTSILISASRRTPDWAVKWMREQHDANMVWPDPGGARNPYRGFLAWGDGFAVTPDSVNMVSEVLGTGKPLVTQRAQARGKIDRFLSEGANRGLISDTLDLSHRYPPLAEAQRIAMDVRRRMGDR